MDNVNQAHHYKITCLYIPGLLLQFEKTFTDHDLKYKRLNQIKSGNSMASVWVLQGTRKAHKRFVDHMLQDNSVAEFEF